MIVDNEQINDLKSFLNINEKGSDSIVFQFGSHSVKFGLASQLTPFVMPNCIAYKKYENYNNENEMIIDSDYQYEIRESFQSNLLNIEQDIIKKQIKLEQKMKGKINYTYTQGKLYLNKYSENSETEFQERKKFEQIQLSTTNIKKAQAMAYDLNEDISENNFKWTAINDSPSYLVGREALCLSNSDRDKYIIRFPIKYGMFNTEYPHQAVLDDLNKIIQFCVINFLQINKKEFMNFNIVLIIPDLFIKQQVKALINLFLRDLNFKGIFLHTESVMSSFGAALQSSCVVDIGSSKISVCCVDEGQMIEESLIRKNYGGDDITKLLFEMLSRRNPSTGKQYLPIEDFNVNNEYHFRIVEKIKENECELPSNKNSTGQFNSKTSKVWVHRKSKNTKLYTISFTEPIYVAPLSLFYTEILEPLRNVTIPPTDFYNDIYCDLYSDPEDVMPDLIKTLLTENRKEENLIGSINLNLNSSVKKSKHEDDDESLSRSDDNSSQIYDDKIFSQGKKNTYESMFKLVPLDDMICQSIMSVGSGELRKRLSNAIILVGGSSKFKEMIDFLEDRLIDKLTEMDHDIDRIEIINYPNVDLKTLTWIGGSIIPKLESSKDMWVTRERWLMDIEKLEESRETALKETVKEINLNDNESKKDNDGKDKITRKKEKHLDVGVNLIREKSAFQW